MDSDRHNLTIIAEVGSNHNGSLDQAFELIDVAADLGADVVKFQSFLADQLLAADDPNYERIKRLEVPRAWYPLLMERCEKRGVSFLSTATNETTMAWMEELHVAAYKVASCNITHRPLLDQLIATGKSVIVSTGMATLDEILETARHFRSRGLRSFSFLHCVSKYPTPPEDMRLGNIPVLRALLGCPIGLSDHSPGSHIAVAAVALGATIIEKHISLDKTGIGLDHEVAVVPQTFGEMCRQLREVAAALNPDFSPDLQNIRTMRRSVRFTRPLTAGSVVQADDLKVTRPEDGLKPEFFDTLIGRRLTRDVAINEATEWGQFEGAHS